MMLTRSSKVKLYAITTTFLTSLLATFLFLAVLPEDFKANENSDYIDFYEPVARNILKGEGFILADNPNTLAPPGYPLLLAGVFGLSHLLNISEGFVLYAFIMLCGGLSSVFLFVLACSVWGPLPALSALLLWITYPFALWMAKQPNSETPFLTVLYGGFCVFWVGLMGKRRGWLLHLLAGFLIGIAMLIRPVAIGLGFVMSLSIWLMKREMPLRSCMVMMVMLLLGNLVAILPWEIWLYSKTGKVILLGTYGNVSIVDGLTFAVGGTRPKGGVPDDVAGLMWDLAARRDNMDSLSGTMAIMAEELYARPVAVAKLLLLKAMRSWYGTDSRRFEVEVMLLQFPYLLMMLWSSRKAWRLGEARRQLTVSIWLVGLYFWGMTILVSSMLRYMVPAVGLLFVLIPACFLRRTHCEHLMIDQDEIR